MFQFMVSYSLIFITTAEQAQLKAIWGGRVAKIAGGFEKLSFPVFREGRGGVRNVYITDFINIE